MQTWTVSQILIISISTSWCAIMRSDDCGLNVESFDWSTAWISYKGIILCAGGRAQFKTMKIDIRSLILKSLHEITLLQKEKQNLWLFEKGKKKKSWREYQRCFFYHAAKKHESNGFGNNLFERPKRNISFSAWYTLPTFHLTPLSPEGIFRKLSAERIYKQNK